MSRFLKRLVQSQLCLAHLHVWAGWMHSATVNGSMGNKERVLYARYMYEVRWWISLVETCFRWLDAIRLFSLLRIQGGSVRSNFWILRGSPMQSLPLFDSDSSGRHHSEVRTELVE